MLLNGFAVALSIQHAWQLLKVREAVSILDLDVMFYPCPAGGPTWRENVKQKGGKASFPYMVDPNTGAPQAVLNSCFPPLHSDGSHIDGCRILRCTRAAKRIGLFNGLDS